MPDASPGMVKMRRAVSRALKAERARQDRPVEAFCGWLADQITATESSVAKWYYGDSSADGPCLNAGSLGELWDVLGRTFMADSTSDYMPAEQAGLPEQIRVREAYKNVVLAAQALVDLEKLAQQPRAVADEGDAA